MAKSKQKTKKFQVQKKDVFQRLNFLYQAAHMALSMTPPNITLSRHYTHTMITCASKNVVRLSPHIKRTLCKHCHTLLLPKITSKFTTKGGKIKKLITHCLQCGAIKSLLMKPDYELWHDKQENTSEILSLQPAS